MANSYSAAERRSRGALWPSFAPARIASIVNIEAGRQHAPLHVLWQIAGELGTDLALLIPRREDLLLPDAAVPLDQETIDQIEAAAHGNPETARAVTALVGKLKASIEKQHQSRTSSAKTKLRK